MCLGGGLRHVEAAEQQHGYDEALWAFDAGLARLGLDYLDLYLIRWPVPRRDRCVPSWQALETLLREGRVRSIGVSNFGVETLTRLIGETAVAPAVNQIELHPQFARSDLRDFQAQHGVATVAWRPLQRAGAILEDSVVTTLAARHRRTAAQIALRWHLQLGNAVIPGSADPVHIRENLDVFDFALAASEMPQISGLDCGLRLGEDPMAGSRRS